MPAITGQRKYNQFNIGFNTALVGYIDTALLTDIGQDDETTGHANSQSITVNRPCPNADIHFTTYQTALIDRGLTPDDIEGTRFTFRCQSQAVGTPTYCPAPRPSTHLIEWRLFLTPDFSVFYPFGNGTETSIFSGSGEIIDHLDGFFTVVLNTVGLDTHRYLILEIKSTAVVKDLSVGSWATEARITDWGASDTPYMPDTDGTPDVPTGLTGPDEPFCLSQPGNYVDLTWGANTDGLTQTYEVVDRTRGFLAYIGAANMCRISNLVPGETYEFQVRAVGAVADSATVLVPGNQPTWTDSTLFPCSQNFRVRATGVVIFNNAITPPWNAYPEGGYTPENSPVFPLVDYYDPTITFGVPITQIADSRPYSLALKFTLGGAPLAGANSVFGAFNVNRFLHLTWNEIITEAMLSLLSTMDDPCEDAWFIFNDTFGDFGDNELDPYAVLAEVIDPANISDWSPSLFLTPATPPVPLLTAEASCCDRFITFTFAILDEDI